MLSFARRQWKIFISHMDPGVFLPSAGVVLVFVVLGVNFPSQLESGFRRLQDLIASGLSWFYVVVMSSLLILCLVLAYAPWSRAVRLGDDDSQPEFSRMAWLAMLFSAGMGIGVVFWGVAEPLTHFVNPPPDVGLGISTVRTSMVYTFFHWALHPWAVYAIFALAIAYAHFRLKLPLAPRSLLHPLLPKYVNRWPGKVFDTICTVGTLMGVATSLGFGAMQINTGFSRVFTQLPHTTSVQVTLIIVITLIATISVVSGIEAGIKTLSLSNVGLALLLTILVFFAGPTLYIINTFISGLGNYIAAIPVLSTHLPLGDDGDWQARWTTFYWGWWLSWSPFVGIFVARISKGRTVREFIFGVLFIPALATIAWFAIYGGTAIFMTQNGADPLPAATIIEQPSIALHTLLEYLGLGKGVGALATLLIIIFFITSSDSGSLVDDMVTSGGDPNPPKIQRVFWAFAEGAVAVTLLIGGGLTALQTASITAGFPMAIVLIIGSWGLVRIMRKETPVGG